MDQLPTTSTVAHGSSGQASSLDRVVAPHRARHTLLTLLLATFVCTGMLLVRFVWSGNVRFAGFFWNLILAWIPLAVTLFIRRLPPLSGWRRSWFWFALIAWILFFPNAFYLVTDLIHTKKFGTDGVARWFDMLMTAGFAFAGVFVGCLSLYLMHLFVRQRFGWRLGWVFATTALALGSFGIYLGRVLRLNSWDVVARPFKLMDKISTLSEPATLGGALGFSAAFFAFSLATYMFVVSIARIHEPPQTTGSRSPS